MEFFTTEELIQDYGWTEESLERLRTTKQYRDIADIVVPLALSLPQKPIQLCGPISTGGLGDKAKNLEVFAHSIRVLRYEEKAPVFNQMPFEECISRIWKKRSIQLNGVYDMAILEDLYVPLFQSGAIREIRLLPGWEESTGTRREVEVCKQLGLPIQELLHTWHGFIKNHPCIKK